MLFLHTLRYPRWFGSYCLSKAMVDYQLNFNEWQDTATFFPSEPVDDSFNFDEFLGNGKANNEVGQTIPGLPDLEWFDEKVDLSFIDDPYSVLAHPNETETLMVEDAVALLGLMDSNLDTSSLSSQIPLNGFNDLLKLDVSNIQSDPSSSEYSESHLASPGCTSLQINSPQFFESPVNSPASSHSDPLVEYVPIETALSPAESVSSWSVLSGNTDDCHPTEVSVTVCEPTESCSLEVQEASSIEEISNSVKQRKYVSNGKEIPKVVLKNSFHPYSKAQAKLKDRRERKKVQNKEAAARYREKKRMEEKELSGEVTCMQLEQKKLQDTHDKLQSEIKYLKSLMREILEKKGVIK